VVHPDDSGWVWEKAAAEGVAKDYAPGHCVSRYTAIDAGELIF
jgi:hypothetical protein